MTVKDELIICRCERVKFAQIHLATHRCGAQTVNQIKKATRAGMVSVAGLKANGAIKAGTEEKWPVDAVVTAAGLYPLVELLQAAGCPLVQVSDLGGWVPVHDQTLQTPVDGLFVAGSVSGVEGSAIAESQGRLAGLAAAGYLELAEQSQIARLIVKYQADIVAARKIIQPFFPAVAQGREYQQKYSLNFFRDRPDIR